VEQQGAEGDQTRISRRGSVKAPGSVERLVDACPLFLLLDTSLFETLLIG